MNAEEQIRKFQEFIEDHYKASLLEAVSTGKAFFTVDFAELSKFDPALAEELLDSPEESLKAIEIACRQIDLPNEKRIRPRIANIPESRKIMISNIRSEHIGKLLCVEGIVRRKTDVRPQVVNSKFECPSCGQVISILQVEQSFREPSKCSCGRKGKFTLLSKELVDAQGMVLEETAESLEGGAQPKNINMFLKEDLVTPISEKRTNPGSRVMAVGILKELPKISKSGAKSTMFDLMIEANNIEGKQEDFYEVQISKEEEKKILELSRHPQVYEKLTGSIAPSIYGYEKVKEALLLQLMGGVMKKRIDGVTTRGDIHVMLVGDPGSGKSQILKRMSKIAPKGRYISGKSVTGAGMTAAVVRDELLGGWTLEAGALVLANNGVVCIDELDKMDEHDSGALHEAMEQQSYHPDSEIMLSDGSTHKIGPLVDGLFESNKDKKVLGINCEILPVEDLELLTTDFRNVFQIKANRVSRHSAPDYFIEISFSNGRKIVVTPEHPVYLFRDGVAEIPAEHVKINDLSFAPRILPTKSREGVSKNLGRLLGYLAAEGHTYFNEKHRYAEIGITSTDKKIIGECANLFGKIFKLKPNINLQKKESRKWAKLDIYTVRISSLEIYSRFKKDFPELMVKAPSKRIPNKLKVSSSESKREFLAAAFKGDGFIDSERFGYSTSSYGLAKDFQDLLLGFHITSYISTEARADKKYFKVVVSSSRSMAVFREKIAEADDKRLARIDLFCKRSYKKTDYRDPVPPVIVKRVDALLRKLRLSTGHFNRIISLNQNSNRDAVLGQLNRIRLKLDECAVALHASSIRAIGKGSLTPLTGIKNEAGVSTAMVYYVENRTQSQMHSELLQKTRSVAEKRLSSIEKELEQLLSIVKSDLRFVTVKSVRRIENENVKWVYDVTVEPTKTFISEGLVLHNTLSVSKANIHATLYTRTTVLVAANPKWGRFDPFAVLATQIDMPPTLINRFDLIFPIKDLPDPTKDEKMARHILFLHQSPETIESEIETDFLKKYVAYARQKVNPVLTDAALNEIKDFYVQMRSLGMTDEITLGMRDEDRAIRAIPISARQLEALIRLSEASARVRLSDKVTKADARRAIELITYCLLQVGLDRRTGQIDIDRITTGIPASERGKIYTLREIIRELEGKIGKTIPIEEVLNAALGKGMNESDFEQLVEKLKREGDLWEPRPGFLSRM